MIKIYPPSGFTEIGKRAQNEDAIFPEVEAASSTHSLFMVCDGVGGKAKGELASSILTKVFPEYIVDNDLPEKDPMDYYQKGLKKVEESLDEYRKLNPESAEMASTLTFLHIQDGKIVLGWVGDSRIYHIRNGTILFKSNDHSLVNKLVSVGEITEEEAEVHPQRNVILRAVKGREEPAKMDVEVIDDIMPDDYFLLCTDGVLEHFKDNDTKWFKRNEEPDDLLQRIIQKAAGKTHDNYSAYLIKIHKVDIRNNSKTKFFNKVVSQKLPLLLFLLGLTFLWTRFYNTTEMPAYEEQLNIKTSSKTDGIVKQESAFHPVITVPQEKIDVPEKQKAKNGFFRQQQDSLLQWEAKKDKLIQLYINSQKNFANNNCGHILDQPLYLGKQLENVALDRFFGVSIAEEKEIGEKVYESWKKEKKVLSNHPDYGLVNTMVTKLSAHLKEREFNYTVTIFESEEINAFATLGGYIYFTSSLLEFVDSPDELAFIVAHELSHISLRHTLRKQQKLMQLHSLGKMAGREDFLGLFMNVNLMLSAPFGQVNEYEADQNAFEIAKAAGYNPYRFADFFKKLEKYEHKDLLGKLMSTHPFPSDRKQCIESYIRNSQ